MEEESKAKYGPLEQFLSKNDWVSPELLSTLQSSEILSAGMKDPKCLYAIQKVMSISQASSAEKQKQQQADPVLADPTVSAFLKEFSSVMAVHFEKLAQQGQAAPTPSQPAAVVEEIGPLHAQALKAKSRQATSAPPEGDEKVQQVLADPELRALLMDGELQRVLVECADPVRFREHMRDPTLASPAGCGACGHSLHLKLTFPLHSA
eukprot:CAMPEP_0170101742 /NCGR_PEP_ID=MMETSP0020_2-20130122/2441_1 /TAXON_ID=98059 /ORGANISM="Dinobryon sp., Strain UTEXLB2267" /LENGTH=206 /DNA_ID=CAMNT_0010324899 /DNA_START=256 /DNA_END=876 /DNA_ORIENTATION=+